MKSAELITPDGFKITMVSGDRGQLIIFRAFEGRVIPFDDSRYTLSDEGEAMIAREIGKFCAGA